MHDTRPQQAAGVLTVNDIVQVGMCCGWQEISAINDNGIDGLIIDRVRGIDTGSLYYVQVKCGDGYLKNASKRSAYLGINLGGSYLENHRPRWNRLQGPVILVYVDYSTRKAWWADLKSDTTFCPEENMGLVLVPRHQRFGHHSIGQLRRLRGFYDLDRVLDVVKLSKADLVVGPFSAPLKKIAQEFYSFWATSEPAERTNPALGVVAVSRVGWRHISRRGRGYENIVQSWSLLGAARRIVLENRKPYQLRKPDVVLSDDFRVQHDYVSLRSRVVFPNRQEAVVQVVIRRKITINQNTGEIEARNWLYSVHEPRKGKGAQ